MFLWILSLLVISVATAERTTYDGYHVWELTPKTNEQVQLLHTLMEDTQVQLLHDDLRIDRPVEMLIPPSLTTSLYRRLQHSDIDFSVQSTNLQKSLDIIWKRADSPHRAYDKGEYNTYDDIISEIDQLAAESCPAGFECETYSIGSSLEGRDMRLIKISQGSGREAVWMDSLIHAREWLTGATNMRMLDRLMTEYGTRDDVTYLLDNYDWYFLPVSNPDGYDYTFTNERFWRKNRSPNTGGCEGVDLNRNYDAFWGETGSGSSECSDTYRGPSAASEPETQVVQAELDRLVSEGTVAAMWSIHSTVPALLINYGTHNGSSCQRPEDFDLLMRVAEVTADAIENTYGTTWSRGSACEVLYAASGITIDYAKLAGITYCYTPEIRGPGFNPPTSAIEPSFEECWNGVVAMMEEIQAIGREHQ